MLRMNELINHVLQHDPLYFNRLENLRNKQLCVEIISQSPFCFYLQFKEDGIYFTSVPSQTAAIAEISETTVNDADINDDADATLRGPLSAFITFLLTKDPQKASLDGLEIRGDVHFAHSVQNLFLQAEIDWEALLAASVGDTLAHPLYKAVTTFRSSLKENQARLIENLIEYWQEEIKSLPKKENAENFYAEIDQLRNDVARLEAKIKLIEQSTSHPKGEIH